MGEARQHHFVSQCYLKGFTRDGNKDTAFCALDVKSGRVFFPKPAAVAKERDFNFIEGLPAGELERRLSGFEGRVAQALELIVTERSLINEDAHLHLLNFAALLAVRNPRNREMMNRSLLHSYRVILDLALSSREMWESHFERAKAAGYMEGLPELSYEQIKQANQKNPIVEVKDSITAHIRREFEIFDEILPFFVARRWLLCLAGPQSEGFITCDHPVGLMWNDQVPRAVRPPPGYQHKNATVLFPVSREMLAVGTFEGDNGVRTLSTFQVAYFNGLICAHAQRHIYAADAGFSVLVGNNAQPISSDELARFVTERRAIQTALVSETL